MLLIIIIKIKNVHNFFKDIEIQETILFIWK